MIRLLLLAIFSVAFLTFLLHLGERNLGPVVITREGEQKILLLLGNPSDTPTSPGISFRWPFIQETRTFSRRWLHLNSRPHTIQTRDRERLVVDNYAIWRIVDPLLFYKSFPTGRAEAETQIDREVRAKVREVIGRQTLKEVVTDGREAIMSEITEKSAESLAGSGIEIGDVRINRTDLPAGIEGNVYARMRAERNRLARKHRAEGEEEARTLKAKADRNSRAIVAEAKRDSEIIKGEADARASSVYASAHRLAPDFFSFLRSFESYKVTLSKGATLVLPPNHPYLKHFQEGLIHEKGD